ncbi:MAG: FeoC-like transcriptional regulator [Anaerolineales bacterium]
MSKLKQVLRAFQEANEPLSITQIAHQVGTEPAMVEDMIAFWVRKGKLRNIQDCADSCGTCGPKSGGCPFVMHMPKRYELVQDAPQRRPRPAPTLAGGLVEICDIR